MARKADPNKVPTKNVAFAVPVDLYDFLQNLQWDKRMKPSDILRGVVTEYAVSEGYVPAIVETIKEKA